MVRSVILVPVSEKIGLTTVSLGLVNALEQTGVKVTFFKPVAEKTEGSDYADLSTAILNETCNIPTIPPLDQNHAEKLIASNKGDDLLEEVIGRLEAHKNDAQLIVVEGMVPNRDIAFANRFNLEIARTLGSQVVFVGTPGNHGAEEILERMNMANNYFGGKNGCTIGGCIINKIGADRDVTQTTSDIVSGIAPPTTVTREQLEQRFGNGEMKLLGAIPWNRAISAPRVSDLTQYLGAHSINVGESQSRRIRNIKMYAAALSQNEFRAGTFIVTPGDRSDVLVAAALASMNGVDIAGMLLNGNRLPEPAVLELCEEAMARV